MKNPGNETQPSEQNESAVVKHAGPQHTPGPWRLSEKWESARRGEPPVFWGYFLTGSNEHGASILPTLGFAQNFPNNIQANANLMGAAPDMLAAILTTQCPRPVNALPAGVDLTVEQCMGRLECGCDLGAAVSKATGIPANASTSSA